MPHRMYLRLSVALLAVAFSSLTHAGQAAITWGDTAAFTDIDPTNTSRQNFTKSLKRSFDDEFSKLAKRLPQGYLFSVHITNIDLAGKVDVVAATNGMKVRSLVGNTHFPQMRFDYKVIDASGAVVLEQTNVQIQDVYFFQSVTSSIASSTNFYYEFQMLETWFKSNVLTKVK